MSDDRHWSEASGEWYYVGTVADQWDYIRHDVEAEDLTADVAGMFILNRDGSSTPAPTTRAAWAVLAGLTWELDDDHAPACVGRVVNGMCQPIGTDEEDESDD